LDFFGFFGDDEDFEDEGDEGDERLTTNDFFCWFWKKVVFFSKNFVGNKKRLTFAA